MRDFTKKNFTKIISKLPEFKRNSLVTNLTVYIKSRILAGLLFLTPLAVTVWILYNIFILTDKPVRMMLQSTIGRLMPGFEGIIVPGIGLLITLFIIFLAGVLGKNVMGKSLLNFSVGLIQTIPFGNKIYTTIHEITHSILGKKRKALQQAVLVEYPRRDSWVIAFQTAETQEYLLTYVDGNSEKYVNLFVPTTPNPTSGFMIIVPVSSIRYPGITVEEAVKIIVSGGAFDPRNIR